MNHQQYYLPAVKTFFQGFLVGTLSISSFYYLLLWGVTGDFHHPWQQFLLLQPWMSLLIVGFSIQLGLFWLLKNGYVLKSTSDTSLELTTGTSTAMSGLAMVACCAHHLVDVLPILGLSAAAIFLSQYQNQFLMFSVFINTLGIIFMLWLLTGNKNPLTLIFNIKTIT